MVHFDSKGGEDVISGGDCVHRRINRREGRKPVKIEHTFLVWSGFWGWRRVCTSIPKEYAQESDASLTFSALKMVESRRAGQEGNLLERLNKSRLWSPELVN